MLIPSTLVLSIAALFIVMLAATDWYIWGLSMVSNPRQPRHPQPLTGLELVDLALNRLIAVNEAVLPRATFEKAQAKSMHTTDPGDGFKRVA